MTDKAPSTGALCGTASNPIRATIGSCNFCARAVFFMQPSTTMKTLLSFLSTFALISGIASLDAQHWDSGILFPALVVAMLAAFALADGPRPARLLLKH